MRFSCLCGLALFALLSSTASALADPALAMLGAPKYPPDFQHFDYVNPSAPQGGTLKMGVVGSFDSLNPFLIRGQAPQGLDTGVFSLVYQSLMTRSWDEPFTLYGLIAAGIDVPQDRSAIIFTLNPKAHWQDGTKITADDVLFSFETLRDQGRPNHRTYYKKVSSVQKLSDSKIRFDFNKNPDGSIDREMPLIMGLMPILPKHDWAGRTFNETTLRPPVGSGPYKIEAVDPGRSILYRRDPNYWAKDLATQRGLYNFDLIRMDYYRDESMALQAFKAGAFDLRRETDANRWALGYDTTAVTEGKIKLESFPHHRPEPMRGFVLNERRPLFQDPALRLALALAFDDGWIKKALFQNLPKRTNSFFANSELATDATSLPSGQERAVLEKYEAQLPPDLLTAPVLLPSTEGNPALFRDNLLKAAKILKDNGYTLETGQVLTKDGAPVRFEILLGDPLDEKIALSWARGLKRLGIAATTRTVDSAQYQARLTSFDYDVTTARWVNSLSPGNEQSAYWNSLSAHQKGSRNYPGIQNAAIDQLAAAIPQSTTRDQLVATTKALDRALLATHTVVPFFYLGADQIAFWQTRLTPPNTTPLYGTVLESWWSAQPSL